MRNPNQVFLKMVCMDVCVCVCVCTYTRVPIRPILIYQRLFFLFLKCDEGKRKNFVLHMHSFFIVNSSYDKIKILKPDKVCFQEYKITYIFKKCAFFNKAYNYCTKRRTVSQKYVITQIECNYKNRV